MLRLLVFFPFLPVLAIFSVSLMYIGVDCDIEAPMLLHQVRLHWNYIKSMNNRWIITELLRSKGARAELHTIKNCTVVTINLKNLGNHISVYTYVRPSVSCTPILLKTKRVAPWRHLWFLGIQDIANWRYWLFFWHIPCTTFSWKVLNIYSQYI